MAIKSKTLIYTPINAISFRILGGTKIIKPHVVQKKIQSLETPNEIILALNDYVLVKGVLYKAASITKHTRKGIVHYDVSMFTRNKTSTFILPVLGGNRKLFLWSSYFVNAHLNNDNTLTLVYRISNTPLLNKLRSTIESFTIFIESTEIDNQFVAYKLNIRKAYHKTLNYFRKGKYSRFPDSYKDRVLKFHDKDMENIIADVLFKSKRRRMYLEQLLDCEIDSSIDLLSLPTNEEFNIKIYTNDKKE
tara:strand:+ start:37 stop:780 length:744 start_codon:yes stop_codon:yes gene_type:complete